MDLGGHIQGSTALLGHHTATSSARESEISHLHVLVVDECVLRLNITVGEVVIDHFLETL